MHFHCEVIIPPTDDVEAAVASVMKRFDENQDDEEGYTKHAFWDFFVIGGRFAGTKLMAGYDQAKIAEFEQWLQDEKITVAGLVCGKQELSPSSQIPKVDEKWNEMFPSAGGVMVACPMFRHSNDQYGRDGEGTIEGDICPLKDALAIKCSRVIFAGPSYDSEYKERTGPLEATFMLCDDQWNGVNHMPVKWDQTIREALEQFNARLKNTADGYREQMTPKDDWLAVTVDYHS